MKSIPVVILHGWGLSAETFVPLSLELKAKGYDVFSSDLPGFGSMQIPDRPLSVDDYVEFLHTFLKHKNIASPVLIGHSFGGRVAIAYAHEYPGSLTALVLTGAPGYRTATFAKIILGKFLANAGKVFYSMAPFMISRYLVRDVLYKALGVRDYVRAKGVMKETFKLVVEYNLVPAMSQLKVPTLLLWGKNDGIVPVRIAQKMKKTIPKAKLVVVPGEDHRIPYMNPGIFVGEVEKFLENAS